MDGDNSTSKRNHFTTYQNFKIEQNNAKKQLAKDVMSYWDKQVFEKQQRIKQLYLYRAAIAREKHELQMKDEKRNREEELHINYINRTDVRATYSRLNHEVDIALKAHESALENKRNNLRKKLLEDDSCLTYEYVEKAQKYAQKLNEQKKIKADAIVIQHEKERQAYADEMYRRLKIMNCDELRMKGQLERRRMLNYAHKFQMMEKKQMLEKQKATENMYGEIVCNKNLYNEVNAIKRKEFLDRLQMDECLKKQMYGHEMAKQEQQVMITEENEYWKQLAERAKEEERLNLERKHQKRDNLRQTLLQQIELNRQIKMKRKQWDDEMDRIFMDDLRRDREEGQQALLSMKQQTAKELQEYTKVCQEFNDYKQDLEKKQDQQIFRVNEEKVEEIRNFKIEQNNAKRQLAKDVMSYWDKQVFEKQQRIKQQKQMDEDQRKFFEMFNLDLGKICYLKKREYAKQIQKDQLEQIEYNKRLEKEKKAERVKSELQAMEEAEAKLVECANMDTEVNKKYHPFFKALFPNYM